MPANRRTGGGRGEADLAGVEGCLAGLAPETASRVLAPGEAGDSGSGDDQAVPFGAEATGDVERLDEAMLLPAATLAVDGLGVVGGRLGVADRIERLVEDRLVGFDLGDQEIPELTRGFEGFFDSAWRRR